MRCRHSTISRAGVCLRGTPLERRAYVEARYARLRTSREAEARQHAPLVVNGEAQRHAAVNKGVFARKSNQTRLHIAFGNYPAADRHRVQASSAEQGKRVSCIMIERDPPFDPQKKRYRSGNRFDAQSDSGFGHMRALQRRCQAAIEADRHIFADIGDFPIDPDTGLRAAKLARAAQRAGVAPVAPVYPGRAGPLGPLAPRFHSGRRYACHSDRSAVRASGGGHGCAAAFGNGLGQRQRLAQCGILDAAALVH